MPTLRVTTVLFLVAILCFGCSGELRQVTSTRERPTVASSAADVPFRVVDQAAPLGDHPKEPVYAVITRPEDWEAIKERIPNQVFDQGKMKADYEKEVYLLVYAGVKGSSGYAINVAKLSVEKEQYIVIIAEESPAPNAVVEPAMTLPYILLAVSRDARASGQRLTFTFKDRAGKTLSQQDIQLP